MRRLRNFAIGGIETKIFILLLITVIVLTAASAGITVYQGNVMKKLTNEAGAKQNEASSAIISEAMSSVTRSDMERTTGMQAQIVDNLFSTIRAKVLLVSDYAKKVFADPESFPPKPFAGPDASLQGRVAAQFLWAEGVDREDPAIKARAGLVANLSELMISLCKTTGLDNIYLGVPEGFFLSVNSTAADWFTEDGQIKKYDARSRFWYQQAVQSGRLIFTDLETDVTTGELSLVCAMPVSGPDGKLAAVIGADIYLHNMQDMMQSFVSNGGYGWIMNRDGHVIYSSNEDLGPLTSGSEAVDLRKSENKELAAMAADALAARTDVRLINIEGQGYYMIGEPIPTVSWTLFSAFPKALVDQVENSLLASSEQITEDTQAAYTRQIGRSRNSSLLLMAILTVGAGAAALLLGRRIVKPLNRITGRIAELRGGNLEFKMEDSYRTGDEIQVLAESFASLSHKTLEYVDQVKKATAEKERIGTELRMANRIQESMLPHEFPPFPDRTEFDIYATMNPAREVGGDFYDFFMIDSDHLCLVMADVSGKGVPAALFMMISKTILQSCALLGQSAGAILEKTNEALCANNQEEMFVTVWLGILEISTGRISCANAGHEYPAIFTEAKTDKFELLKDRHGFVIGGMSGVRYTEYEFSMDPGDKLFVYTDGVPEATNGKGEMFGTERMIQVLNECPESTPKELLQTVQGAVDHFVGEADQFDDLTMLCLIYKGTEEKGKA